MKNTLILAAMMMMSVVADAKSRINDAGDHFDVRLGYSVGGTMPLNMPASIRSLNSYSLRPNFQVGADYEKKFSRQWGVEFGLNAENKGMRTDACVKTYHMSMVRGEEEIEGYFTGNVVTETTMWQLAVPIRATFWAHSKLKIKFGPYIAFALSKNFGGYAYDGYLRQDTPTGPRINLGSSKTDRGDYEFKEDLKDVNLGLDLGVDWYLGKRLGVYADLSWGLNNAFRSEFKVIEQAMYPVYGTIGAVYRIK